MHIGSKQCESTQCTATSQTMKKTTKKKTYVYQQVHRRDTHDLPLVVILCRVALLSMGKAAAPSSLSLIHIHLCARRAAPHPSSIPGPCWG